MGANFSLIYHKISVLRIFNFVIYFCHASTLAAIFGPNKNIPKWLSDHRFFKGNRSWPLSHLNTIETEGRQLCKFPGENRKSGELPKTQRGPAIDGHGGECQRCPKHFRCTPAMLKTTRNTRVGRTLTHAVRGGNGNALHRWARTREIAKSEPSVGTFCDSQKAY